MESKILLVEDEPGLVMTLTDRLQCEGYVVEACGDGDSALGRACEASFDLIVLDVMLPKKSGFEVCRRLRDRGILTPVLMLTARDQVVDKVVGLQLGADDYLTKPFDMMELLARISALLRRAARPAVAGPALYRFGDVTVDLKCAQVTRAGRPVELPAREYQLLRYLIENRGRLVARDELLTEVWGYEAVPNTRTVDVHITWLRQKLEPNPKHPEYILTLRGLGYKFAG